MGRRKTATLRILGHNVPVYIQILPEDDEEKTLGDTGIGEPIRLDPGQGLSERASTLFHEILEQVNERLALRISHQVLSQLESSVFPLLWDNGLLNKARWNRCVGKEK